MLIPAFTIEIGHPILRGLTCIGKFDGKNPALTCATSAGKIFFHSPHEKDQKNQVRFLNINRKISALGAGRLNPKLGKDLLLVGAQTTLLCYDVLENKDLFFKDAPDGVNTLVVGKLSGLESEPLVFVGGNCSIQGFDAKGDEAFWTVTGDNVSTMCFCDVDEDGDLELLVGSDDYEIRVFRNEEVVSETTETDRIVALCNIRKTTFGYALANGTVGVYSGPGQRRWRVKAKQQVTCISGFDLDGDGQPELLSGWSNGKFEVRSDTSGEVIFKDTLRDGAAISGILQADYRGDGRVEVIACSAEGEVRGYLPAGEELALMVDQGGISSKIEDDMLNELHQRKQELLFELRQYEAQGAKARNGEKAPGMVDKDTKISVSLVPSTQDNCLYLSLESSNDACIKAAVVFADRLFEGGEALAVHERTPSSQLRVPLTHPKDVPAELQIKALVGGRASQTYQVFELVFQLPKFAMFVQVEASAAKEYKPPRAGVTFVLPGAQKRVRLWIASTFQTKDKQEDPNGPIDDAFISLRDGKLLWLRMTPEAGGTMHIFTEDMELAGDVLQDLCSALQVVEMEALAEFPQEMDTFQSVLLRVDEYNATRLALTAEMADQSNAAKTLVIKAEDARILADIKGMRAAYAELYTLNAELMGEYNKRANNHEQLLVALKEVNHMIQKTARLRVGAAKTRIVTACRAAIKANDIQGLLQIMKSGAATASHR